MNGTLAPEDTHAVRIRLRRHLRADVVAGDAVYVFSERDVTALQGANIETVITLLDGTRSLADVLDLASARIPARQAAATVADLVRAGLVELRPAQPEPVEEAGASGDALAFWDALGLDCAQATELVRTRTVRLLTLGDAGPARSPAAAHVETALRVAGIAVETGSAVGRGTDLSIVLCDDYLAADLAGIDVAHRRAGQPWLLAKPTGSRVWIGPFFEPDGDPEPACWHCLAARLWRNRRAEAHVQTALARPGHAPRPVASLTPLPGLAANVIALEAAKWLAGHRYPGNQSVWTFDSFDLTGRHHQVRRRPECSACGRPDLMRIRGWSAVVPRPGTTGRSAPEDLLGGYGHLIDPVTGVVRGIERDRRGPAFLNSFRSGPSQPAGARGAAGLRAAQRIVNGGKGVTASEAKASALGEALERHCATWRGDEARVRASLRGLGTDAIHPNRVLLYSERQYAEREHWNADHAGFQYVSQPFPDKSTVDWSPVWSLTERRHRFLPTELLYFGAPGSGANLVADSNGNAAGPSVASAVLSGLLELVERDAVALWWYNRLPRPAVDLDALADRWITDLRDVYHRLNRDVWALDITSDLGVCTTVAISRRVDKPCEDIMFGFGTDLDGGTALRRALTELNQMLPAVAGIGPEHSYPEFDVDTARWLTQGTVDNQPYLLPDPDQAPTVPAPGPGGPGGPGATDPYDRVEMIRARIESLGMEVLVLDQTRPDIGLPVVKVIVPGLRHFWARFAPGRLFDVPVKLGRLAEPTRYEDLNPIPMFL